MQHRGFDPPLRRSFLVERIFPLELTWVLTPFQPKTVTYAKNSPKMMNPRDVARKAEEEEDHWQYQNFTLLATGLQLLHHSVYICAQYLHACMRVHRHTCTHAHKHTSLKQIHTHMPACTHTHITSASVFVCSWRQIHSGVYECCCVYVCACDCAYVRMYSQECVQMHVYACMWLTMLAVSG